MIAQAAFSAEAEAEESEVCELTDELCFHHIFSLIEILALAGNDIVIPPPFCSTSVVRRTYLSFGGIHHNIIDDIIVIDASITHVFVGCFVSGVVGDGFTHHLHRCFGAAARDTFITD